MAFDIDTVKAYGGTGSDILIQAKIDAFTDNYTCLTSSYSAAVADDIANSYLAGQLQLSAGKTQATQKRAPNGASTSFATSKYGGDGQYGNALIEAAYLSDTNGCLPSSGGFMIGTAGPVYEADNPVYE